MRFRIVKMEIARACPHCGHTIPWGSLAVVVSHNLTACIPYGWDKRSWVSEHVCLTCFRKPAKHFPDLRTIEGSQLLAAPNQALLPLAS